MRPLATAVAAFVLLAAVLVFAPLGAAQGPIPTLSPTPPVHLPPASTTPTTPTSTPTTSTPTTPAATTTPTTPAPAPRPALPKTGLDTWLVALVGLGLIAAGTTLRRAYPLAPVRRRR